MSWVGMSKRELNRIDILARLDSGRLTKAEFAEQLLRVWEGIVNLTDFTGLVAWMSELVTAAG